MKKKILCVVGTRPEAIKMAPVILALKKENWVNITVLATAQHRRMLDQVLDLFDISPDIDLDVMVPNQMLTSLTAKILLSFENVLKSEKWDAVIVQGDTTTVMSVSLACFYNNVPIAHLEAGLRTWDMRNPFPEEANRVIATILAKWHFSPTHGSSENLLREGVPKTDIYLTGNTVIDALLMTASRDVDIGISLDDSKRMILVTCHRRENFGGPIKQICMAIAQLATSNPDVQFLYPVHPNPNVKTIATEILCGYQNIILCEPLDYSQFVSAMKRSYLIITDSGGVQEEAPALGKPVLVLREETERPEAVVEGVVKLIGADYEKIVKETQLLLDSEESYKEMARGISPYGDGQSAKRIVDVLRNYFC